MSKYRKKPVAIDENNQLELIDRNKFIQLLIKWEKETPPDAEIRCSMALAADWIREMKQEDAKLVVHAHWETHYSNSSNEVYYSCSNCHYPVNCWTKLEGKYCPNCGAKMDEEG